MEQAIENLSSYSIDSTNDIEEILLIMKNNPYFKLVRELNDRFWDMFVIDAFISNNDRNEGNWGLILDKETKELRIAPVYDNGAAFYNKSNDDRLYSIFNDSFKFKQSIYDSSISIYKRDGKPINPLKFIESMENEECNKAILRIVPKINLENIEEIFNQIPESYNDLSIISNIQKLFYFNSLCYKYDNVLKPIYNKLNS